MHARADQAHGREGDADPGGATPPPQMSAVLDALGEQWPSLAWLLFRAGSNASPAAVRVALRAWLSSEPLFRWELSWTRAGWRLATDAAVPDAILIDLSGMNIAHAQSAAVRIAAALGGGESGVLRAAAFALAVSRTATDGGAMPARRRADTWVLLALPSTWADRLTMRLLARRFARTLSSPGVPAAALAASAPDYLTFLRWEQEFLREPAHRAMRDRWRARLARHRGLHVQERRGAPGEGGRRASSALASCARRLEARLAEAIDTAARRFDTAPAAVCGAVWGALAVVETTGAPGAIGWEISGRFTTTLETALGRYAKYVPVTLAVSPGDSLAVVLRDADAQLSFAREHQEYYGAGLAEEERVASPYGFDTAFTFDDEPPHGDDASGHAAFAPPDAVLNEGLLPLRFRLRLHVRRRGSGYETRLDYDRTVVARWHAQRLLTRYIELLTRWTTRPEQTLGAASEISARERHGVLIEWNDAPLAAAPPPLVMERMCAVWAAARDRVALVCPDGVWTYGLLSRRVAAVAQRLSRHRVGRGAKVALLLERSPDAIASMLGTMDAGAAYVPLAPDQPTERIASILASCEPAAVITTSLAAHVLPPSFGGAIVLVDDLDQDDDSATPPDIRPSPHDPAYILYTSGSTGRPKGVVISHANLAQSLAARMATYRAEAPGFFLASPLVFDSSVAGIYWTLASGGRLCLPPDRIHDRFDQALELLQTGRVTHALFLPSLYRLILDRAAAPLLDHLEAVILAGEDLPGDAVVRHRQRTNGAELFNEYGLTEASVWSTVYRVPHRYRSGRIPIGRCIPGARLYVLGRQLDPCPAGREGDLYLGGPMVSPGYWRAPDQTAMKFVPDPFAGKAGARMCKTGDRARWRADGTLEFFGRADRQVKVRGVRFELGELEHLLSAQSWIADAAVITTPGDRGDARLLAFVAPRDPNDTRVHDLARVFAAALPPQLLPIPVTLRRDLPRTASGKIDRAQLVPPARDPSLSAAPPPPEHAPIEELIASLWQSQIGAAGFSHADSFWEIGGDSIKAIPVISGIRRMFGVEIGLRALFETPTIDGLARLVEAAMRTQRGADADDIPVCADAGEPLSFAQRRLWFLEALQPGQTAYHCPIAIRVDGVFARHAWVQTLTEIARLQDTLRTVLDPSGDRLQRRILPPGPIACASVDLSGLPSHQAARVWARLTRADAAKPFRLTREVAWRQCVVHLGTRDGRRETGVLLSFHHAVCDFWSMEILIREINQIAPILTTGRVHAQRPPARTYGDFSRWQHALVDGPRGAALVERWRALLAPFTTVAEIPTDFARPRKSTGRGGRVHLDLGRELSTRVAGLARAEHATAFLVLLAACHAMVAFLSGRRNVCIGVPVANRTWPGAEEIVGLFLDTLPVPVDVNPREDFRGLLRGVRETFLNAFAMQRLPFEQMVGALGSARDPGRNPLFQVFFTYQRRLALDLELPAADVRVDRAVTGAAKFDLTIGVIETDDGFQVTLEYDRDLFARPSALRMARAYQHVLATFCRTPSAMLEPAGMMAPHERHRLLIEWNDTHRRWDDDRTLDRLFGDVAARAPDRVAVIDGGARISYAALDAWSDEIAVSLEQCGLAAGETVGVALPRSAEALAAMLGVLKAGMIFVPIDRDSPPVRLRQVVAATGLRVLLSDRDHVSSMTGGPTDGMPPLRVMRVAPPSGRAGKPRPRDGRASDIAYVLFTSGSTDRPKGVRGSHRAILNRFRWMWERSPFAAGEVCASKAPLTFVDALWESFGGLLQGVAVLMIGEEDVRDPFALLHELRIHEVTRIVFIPSFLRLLLDSVPAAFDTLPAMRHVTVSGEPLEPSTVRLFHRSPGRATLLNLYGMTEAAADVTWHVPQSASGAAEPVPIGRPLANLACYVLDSRLEPVAPGVAAELYIGGDGLADGYCGAPEGTAARFVPHPFAATRGERLYRTGDLCSWQPDGQLRYHGRCDRQVKVRGMRVEPAEIEERLRLWPGVVDAAVRAAPSAAGTRLIAYVLLDPPVERVTVVSGEPRAQARAFVADALPPHMVPSELIAMPVFPRTGTGKIDRRALPLPEQVETLAACETADGEGRASPLERHVQRIWQDVLQIEAAPLSANFFDLGGNSFHLIQVQDRVKRELGADVQIVDLFAHPTVKDFAAFVAGGRGDASRAEAFARRVAHRRAALAAPGSGRR